MQQIDLGIYRPNKGTPTLKYKNNLRGFKHKGLFAFVVGDDDNRLFTKSKGSKRFNFVDTIMGDINYYNHKELYFDAYEYNNGRFVSLMDPVH